MKPLLFLLALLAATSAACNTLRTPCQSACYGTQTTNPSDFDDCIKRCQR